MKIILLIMMAGRKFRIFKISVFSILLLLISFGCQNKNSEKVFTGEALGTTYQIKYFSEKNFDTEKALDSIFEVINTSMSTYQTDSDISRINSGDTSVRVDENFKEVFKYSEQIYNESQGYFDPTVGNLVNAYGFGPEKPLKELDSTQLDSLTRLVGFNKLNLENDNSLEKEIPGIYLDFNAIAKGFTIDVLARYLDKNKVENYLIELGGELVAKGKNMQKDSEWIVAIDDPQQKEGNRTFQTILALNNRAMATSGNYRKTRTDSSGVSFVHTINPLTGKAEKSNLLSASVLAENCTLADGYATAFMALGYEKSLEMLEKLNNVDVYFIYAEENGDLGIFASEGFKAVLKED